MVGEHQELRRSDLAWYGMLPDRDHRRVRILELLNSMAVQGIDGKMTYLSALPPDQRLGGDQEIVRDLIERSQPKSPQ